MPATSPLAFLQPTARTILTATPLGGGMPPGTTIGGWKLQSLGHRFGTRTRHAAVNVDTGQQGVMELFDAPSLLGGTYTSCLRAAICDVMRVTHRGVPTFYDWGTLVDGRPYVVRETIDGRTLQELGATASHDVIKIIRGICDIVVAAHEAGVQHGQLALDQILVRDRDGAVVLLDWCFANDIANEALRRAQVTSTKTSRVQRRHSEACDVFDIGVVMLQLLGDDMPKTLESLVLAMCSDEPQARPTIAAVIERLTGAEDSIARGSDPGIGHVILASGSGELPSAAAAPAETSASESDLDASSQLPHAFRIPSFLMSRRWRMASLALACVAPIAISVWHGRRPVATTAEPIATESMQARVDPMRQPAIATPAVTTPAVTTPAVTMPTAAMAEPAAATSLVEKVTPNVAKPVVAKAPAIAKTPTATKTVTASPAAVLAKTSAEIAKASPVERTASVVAKAAPIVAMPAAATVVAATDGAKIDGAKNVAKPSIAKPSDTRTTPAAKPAREFAQVPGSQDGIFLREYQRVGHDLIELERKLGPMPVAELRTAFREIRISEATQSAASRQEATVALKDLEKRIARMQPIEVTDDCKNNPLADGCH